MPWTFECPRSGSRPDRSLGDQPCHEGRRDRRGADIVDAVKVMRDAHGPGKDSAFAGGIGIGQQVDGGAIDSAAGKDVIPGQRIDGLKIVLPAIGVRIDKGLVDLVLFQSGAWRHRRTKRGRRHMRAECSRWRSPCRQRAVSASRRGC